MIETFLENTLAYILIFLIFALVLFIYIKTVAKKSDSVKEKIKIAKELGFHEPVSLHPYINHEICLGSGACVLACPEKDVLGLVNGKAFTINASRCVGHGACFHACPVHAITLVMGTETRGIELPHVSQDFESNVPGIYIAGELGGMGLIKNAVEQGKQAVENISKNLKRSSKASYDVVIVGAGPAGISATLTAAKNNLKFLTIEQDSLGGTVFNFPRAKLVMTSPMDLPLYGKIKLMETSKVKLLDLWKEILQKNNIKINEQEKVINIEKKEDHFIIVTSCSTYTSNAILLAIGRRGSPRKLGIPGEELEKVSYRLLEPEYLKNQNVLIIGGGDSAIESALLLADDNEVVISYRSNSFSRIKPKNLERIIKAQSEQKLKIIFNSGVEEIKEDKVILKMTDNSLVELKNNLVFIFAGGELPTQFLEKTGIKITKKFGETILKH
ncbi:MAG: NAD(P)-binding domain-containing protein [Ignavibacteriales bacterium]|nr:NAD(P)-binding domain-containing protein [Ignavibacteriales bacterium]